MIVEIIPINNKYRFKVTKIRGSTTIYFQVKQRFLFIPYWVTWKDKTFWEYVSIQKVNDCVKMMLKNELGLDYQSVKRKGKINEFLNE